MITWSPEEIIYSDACLVFVVTGIFCAAVRWFHMCRPFDKEAYYFYPARWQVSFFFAAVVMELPYVFAPSSSAVWNYIRIFGILYCPMCLSSIFLRFFRQRGLDEWGDRLFVGVPMLMLLVLMTLAVAGSSLLAESSAILMLAVVLCSVVLLGRMILVTVWVKRRIDEYHLQNNSDEEDFPYKFAAKVLWLPLVWIAIQWVVFLSDSRDVKAVTDVVMSVCLVVLLCAILHPQRTLGPSKVQEDIDRIEGDEEAVIGETMAAEQEACLAEASALTWDEESKRQVLDIILRRYKEQHLQKSDILSEMDKGKAAPASRFIASVGYYNLINMFRLEYARQYIVAHPDAKLAVVAEESGFASGSSFSKAKRSVPEIVPEYVEGVHIA